MYRRRRRLAGGAEAKSAKLFKIISDRDAPALRKALRRRRVTEDRIGDFTPLQWCCKTRSSGELATILIDAGAEVDARRASNGASPLHVSAYPRETATTCPTQPKPTTSTHGYPLPPPPSTTADRGSLG